MAAISGTTGRVYGAQYLIEDCTDTWNEVATPGVALSTVTSNDITGGSAARATTTTVGATTLLMSEAISLPLNLTSSVVFWIRSSVNTAAGDLRLLLDDTAQCASALENLQIPALTANTWRLCNLRLSNPAALTAVISIGLYQQVDLADGTFDIGPVYALAEVSGIKNWSIDYTMDALDVTDYQSDGIREVIGGKSQWSGSFDGDKDLSIIDVAGVMNGWTVSDIVYLSLGESKTDTQTWNGQALVTGISASAPSDGVVTYSYSFEGSGKLQAPSA